MCVFDCDIDGSHDSPNPTHQGISSGADNELDTELSSNQYKLSPSISERLLPGHISLIPFLNTLEDPKKQDKIHISARLPRLDQG